MDPLVIGLLVGIVVLSVVGKVVSVVRTARGARTFASAMEESTRARSVPAGKRVPPGRYGQLLVATSTTTGPTVAPSLFGPTPYVTGPGGADPAKGPLGSIKAAEGALFSGWHVEGEVDPKALGSLAGEMLPILRDIMSPGEQGIPNGWRPLDAPAHLASEWAGAPFSPQAIDPVISRAITTSVRGRDVVAFEYSSRDLPSSDGEHTFHTHHVVAARLPVALPTLELSVDGPVGLLTRGVAGHDVVMGDPEFDARFRVVTPDFRFAREVLTPGLRAWLVSYQQHPWRIEGRDVLTWRAGQQSIARVLDDVERVLTIADAIPPHLLRTHGFGGDSG